MPEPEGFDLGHREYVVIERDVLQDNILLFDAKCAILLAFAGALIFRCMDKFAELMSQPSVSTPWPVTIALALYPLATFGFAVTVYLAWQVVKPRLIKSSDIFHWGSPAFQGDLKHYSTAIHKAERVILKEHALALLYNLATICNAKDHQFHRAALLVETSTVVALLAELSRVAGAAMNWYAK